MCKICELAERQGNVAKELGLLSTKRKRALMMGKLDEAKELRDMLTDTFERVLKLQDQLPNLMIDPDIETLTCSLSPKK